MVTHIGSLAANYRESCQARKGAATAKCLSAEDRLIWVITISDI